MRNLIKLALVAQKKLRPLCQMLSGSQTLRCALVLLVFLGLLFLAQSCNVVRTITNKSEYYQRGDTSVMIQTKTTESYDAKKNLNY